MTPTQKIELLKSRNEQLESALMRVKIQCEDKTLRRAAQLRAAITASIVFSLAFKMPEDV